MLRPPSLRDQIWKRRQFQPKEIYMHLCAPENTQPLKLA